MVSCSVREASTGYPSSRGIQSTVSPIDVMLVSTVNKRKLATANGGLCGTRIDIMLDSGSSVSLIIGKK